MRRLRVVFPLLPGRGRAEARVGMEVRRGMGEACVAVISRRNEIGNPQEARKRQCTPYRVNDAAFGYKWSQTRPVDMTNRLKSLFAIFNSIQPLPAHRIDGGAADSGTS